MSLAKRWDSSRKVSTVPCGLSARGAKRRGNSPALCIAEQVGVEFNIGFGTAFAADTFGYIGAVESDLGALGYDGVG